MNRALTVAALLGLISGTAYARSPDSDQGVYVGGGLGQFNIKIDDIDSLNDAVNRLDDDDTAWQAFIGFRFNRYLSLQGAYIDYGRPEDQFNAAGSNGRYRLELAGFAPSVIGTLPLGPIELSGKVGYYFYDLKIRTDLNDIDNPDVDSNDNGRDLMFGVGIGMTLFQHLNAKIEYETIDLENVDDSHAFWATAAWRF